VGHSRKQGRDLKKNNYEILSKSLPSKHEALSSNPSTTKKKA
jgi:hypothetical protein